MHVHATVFNSYLLEASLLDGCSKESHWEMCGVLFTELLHAECSLRYIETTDLSKGHELYKFKSNGIDLWDSSLSKFIVQCFNAYSMIVNYNQLHSELVPYYFHLFQKFAIVLQCFLIVIDCYSIYVNKIQLLLLICKDLQCTVNGWFDIRSSNEFEVGLLINLVLNWCLCFCIQS